MKNPYHHKEGSFLFNNGERVAGCGSDATPQTTMAKAGHAPEFFRLAVFGLLLVVTMALTGCAHQYVMKLTNGMEVTSSNKPKLKGANFYYKGPRGEVQVIPQSRVREVEPASMARDENKFKVSEPRKKHWYWPF